MSIKLFEVLLDEIDGLLAVGKRSLESALSSIGEQERAKDAASLEQSKVVWKRYLDSIAEKRNHLVEILNETNVYESNAKIDQQLAYFRSLPRRLSEGADPEWSAYYGEIRKHMGNIHDLLIDIDTKYKLGQHRWD